MEGQQTPIKFNLMVVPLHTMMDVAASNETCMVLGLSLVDVEFKWSSMLFPLARGPSHRWL
eukprot:11171210-Lingulodinium_polyedra.AAC.1